MRQLKKRLPRIDRHQGIHVAEDENQHLWAVSYSDFLMALLAFFILFFSMDDTKKDQLILKIKSMPTQKEIWMFTILCPAHLHAV